MADVVRELVAQWMHPLVGPSLGEPSTGRSRTGACVKVCANTPSILDDMATTGRGDQSKLLSIAAMEASSVAKDVLPCADLQAILLPAFEPCPNFAGPCRDAARWEPATGHVPRGFVGALGDVQDVELVLLTAEPGNPLPGEFHDAQTPLGRMESTCRLAYGLLLLAHSWRDRNLQFFRNLRWLLDRCWPGQPLNEQLQRTWIVDSYLCSAPIESGPVLEQSWAACRDDYLTPQLAALDGALVVTLGGKARQRCSKIEREMEPAYSVAPPGGNYPKARESWLAVAELLHKRQLE